MIKKLLIVLTMAILFSSIATFASPSMSGETILGKVSLSEQEIDFSLSPFILNDNVMVPAKTLCEKLGSQVLWIEESSEFISYRDNIFIKFKANSKIAYVNGKAKVMPVSAFFYNGVLFIPASFASDAFELNFIESAINHSISIDFRVNILEYLQIGYRHFKRVSLTNYGISFYIPEYWTEIDDKNGIYGVENEFESYKFETKILPLNQKNSRTLLSESLLNSLIKINGDSLIFISRNTTDLGEYTSDVIYYDIINNNVTTHHILYVFFEQYNSYIFTASYPDTNALDESKETFDAIARTFSITKLSINEQLEHYTELARFYDYGIKLSSEIYSNMIVDNRFLVSGTVTNSKAIQNLHVIVTKGDEKFDYHIPVINQSFSGYIYTPFGIGKHNITIVADEFEQGYNVDAFLEDILPEERTLDFFVNKSILKDTDHDETKTILKFSVLNASGDIIKHLLPTEYVNYDHLDVYNKTNSITFNLTNEYSKARTLYEWIVKNYDYTTLVKDSSISNTLEILSNKEANSVELCILYTGLLRAVDIPARIVRGLTEDKFDYWVETYINGQWLVAAIAQEDEFKLSTITYFNLDANLQYSNYLLIEYLTF